MHLSNILIVMIKFEMMTSDKQLKMKFKTFVLRAWFLG